MLVFQYPQRLDASHKTHRPLHMRSFLFSWSALPLLVNHTKAVLLPKVSTYISTLHQPTLQPSAAARPTCGSGSRNCKTSHRCLIINTFPPLPVPALSLLGAGRLIAFGADQPTRIIYGAQAAFSDFRGRDVYRRPNLNYYTPRLFSMP